MTTTADTDVLIGQVMRAVAGLRPGRELLPDDRFTDLGLDSLDRLSLAVAVERATGAAVPDEVIASASCGADLAARLRAHSPAPAAGQASKTATMRPPLPVGGPSVGDGTRIWDGAKVADGARVGAGCTLGGGAFVGPGADVGDLVKIGNWAGVFGAFIGDGAMICPGAMLLEDPAPRGTTPDGKRKGAADWTARPVTVLAGATVGAGAVIAPGVTVGAHAMVAIGAVVVRDVPAHALVLGNPARQVGWVCRCGTRLADDLSCPACPRLYANRGPGLVEQVARTP